MVSMAHDLHPNEHSVETSVEEKGDASKGVYGGTEVDGDSFISGDPAMTVEDSDSNLFDKSVTVGASLAQMGDAKEDDDDDDYGDNDISDEDSDRPAATTQNFDSNSDYYDYECRFKCLGCSEPEKLYDQPAENSPFFDCPSDEECPVITLEELLEGIDKITPEQYNEALLAYRRALERDGLLCS